jgi:outer membrane protein assembly factor BamB
MKFLRRLALALVAVILLLTISLLFARIYFAHSGVEAPPGVPTLLSIVVTPRSLTMAPGTTHTLAATGYYTDGSKKDLTSHVAWSSLNPDIATVGANGALTSLKSGHARMNVMFETQGSWADVTVGSPTLVSLAVSPAGRSIGKGQSIAFQAIGFFSDGTTKDLSNAVAWSSTLPSVAEISSTGVASWQKVAAASSTTIRASLGPISTVTSLSVTPNADGFAGVLTYRNDLARTGQNLNEFILKPHNVNRYTFGRLFSIPVDGYLYAQPLYVPALDIPGHGLRNMVYAATENNTVYALDADNPRGEVIWKAHLGPPVPYQKQPPGNCTGIEPTIGITSTPVIDPVTDTIYVVARTLEGADKFFYRLHAMDLKTGAERPGSPVVISGEAHFPVVGDGEKKRSFDPSLQLQRTGLALANGRLYVGFGANCDYGDFHGWLFSYDALSLKQTGLFLSTPTGENGGIWQSGAAPAIDPDNHIFVATGDGTFDKDSDGLNYGDSILKLSQAQDDLHVDDYFSPTGQKRLDTLNLDLGSGGTALLPDQAASHSHLLVASGKDGSIYVLDRDSLGHFNSAGEVQAVQLLRSALNPVFSTPAVWQDSAHTWVYFGATLAKLKAYTLEKGALSVVPSSQSDQRFGPPGSSPVVSADGTKDGIVWILAKNMGDTPTGARAYTARLWSIVTHPRALFPFLGRTLNMLVHPSLWSDYFGRKLPTIHTNQVSPVVLRAYDATNLSDLLYSSDQAPNERDQAGLPVKFAVPIVANGKVYFGTQDRLEVYGLLQ